MDVNRTGNGAPAGTIYVADSARIQRLSPTGSFERLWGADVIEAGAPGDIGNSATDFEICTVASDCTSGEGSWIGDGIAFNGVASIAVNQATGNVYATGGNGRVYEFGPDGSFIRLWGWDVIRPGKPGDAGTGFEICDATAGDAANGSDCKTGEWGANGGQFDSSGGNAVATNLSIDSSGDVWVPDSRNRRIQEFDEDGHFIAAYGYNVDALGGGGGLEKCTSTAPGACQSGTEGSGPGQFSANNPREIAFDSSGNLYALDRGNNRVQRFDPTLLASAITFGAATFSTYTTGAPEHVVAAPGGTRLFFSLSNDVTANPAEQQILEVDPTDASVKDTSLAGTGLGDVQGLALSDSGALLAMSRSSDVIPRPILVFGAPLPAIAPTMNEITIKTDTTATFTATVDPNGGWVGLCKFQYSTDQLNWTDLAAPGCDALAIGGGVQTVSQNVTKLTPHQHYFVRFQASRPLTPGSTVTTSEQAFDTVAPPPVVTDVSAVNVSNTSARMVGTIDPRNAATDYVFEYGTTPALGSSTDPLAIGAGSAPITVSQMVGGLSPDTTYYYRLAATNPSGTTPSPVVNLHTRLNPLPSSDGRRWEMVSPPDKNFTGADNRAYLDSTNAGVSTDGNAVGFCTTALFGEPPGRMTALCAPYIARRSSGGWQTSHPFPEYCYTDPVSGVFGFKLTVFPAADYSSFVIGRGESAGCRYQPLSPAAPLRPESEGGVVQNIYSQDSTTSPVSYDLLTPHLSYNQGGLSGRVVGGSKDFSHVVYMIDSNQTDPPDSPEPGMFTKLYSWEKQGEGSCAQPGGCLSLVSKDTSNVPFTTSSRLPAYGGGGVNPIGSAVSDDGDRIFFAPVSAEGSQGEEISYGGICGEAGCEVYMRENATTTFDVSASECTVSCGSPETKADSFVTATPSGKKAFFLSCAKLTDASSPQGSCVDMPSGVIGNAIEGGAKLYRWDRSAAPGQRLLDLTVDHEAADGEQPDAGGVLGASADGDTVYFTADSQLVAGQPTGPGSKIYRWQWKSGNPTVDYLGPYGGVTDGTRDEFNLLGTHRIVTPDGKYLVVYTKLQLTPAIDRDTDADVYRWDEEGGWTCLSCQRPGTPSAGDVDLENVSLNPSWPDTTLRGFRPKPEISDDGQRVFFGTPDALVPEDVNGEVGCPVVARHYGENEVKACFDVYEWHDGTVSLISSGTSPDPSRLVGTTPSGDDVFFYTSQRLVGWDVDDNVDIYDSRVNGGFAEPPAQPPICEGEACRGAGTSAPSATGAGTAVFEGAGDPAPKHKTVRKRHKKRQHRHRATRHHQRAANHDRRAER